MSPQSKRFCILMGAFFLAAYGLTALAAIGQTTPEKTLKIPDGTIVQVIITEPLSSNTSHSNDPVHFEAGEDVKVGDVVVITKGAEGVGHVITAEKSGRWGKGGMLDYSLDYIKAVDGTNVRLRASSSSGTPNKYSAGALMLGLSGAFKHGKKINVEKGAKMSAYVDGDREIKAINPAVPAPKQ
jgi:hypothetical protein